MKITIPKIGFSGKPIEGAMERVLSKSQTAQPVPQTPEDVVSKDGFIYIPTAGIHFAKQRTHLGKKWNEAYEALSQEGLRMPTIEEFRRTLSYFKNSPEQELKEFYNEIAEVREPWRANWIDAYFEQRKDGFYILTSNKAKEEKLEDCLMKDKVPGISIDKWIDGKNVTSQGIPSENINEGKLYYWHPINGRVAGFDAYSDRAYLICNWIPSNWYSNLGVFGVTDADASDNARLNEGGIK